MNSKVCTYMSSLEKCKSLSVANVDSSGILQKFRILMDLIYYLKKEMALPNLKGFFHVHKILVIFLLWCNSST